MNPNGQPDLQRENGDPLFCNGPCADPQKQRERFEDVHHWAAGKTHTVEVLEGDAFVHDLKTKIAKWRIVPVQ